MKDNMESKQAILQKKYARIIKGIAEKQNISIEEALDRFYHSVTFKLIQEGVADMHCMSDNYLVDEFIMEWNGEFEALAKQQAS